MAARNRSLQQWLQGYVTHQSACLLQDITSDSREVLPGTAFLAYPGLRADGRDYIHDALARGAAAIVYEADEKRVLPQTAVPMIPIPDLAKHVADLAARFYGKPSEALKVVGVTGTNGKTSCVQFIAQALQKHGLSSGLMGTLGNGFLPDLQRTTHTTLDAVHSQKVLAALKQDRAKVVAMEVSSHALDQGRVKAVDFDIAVLTQLSRDHLDYHGDMAAYAQAKSRLFEQPGLDYAVLNIDDAFGRQLVREHVDRLNVFAYSAAGNRADDVPGVLATSIVKQQTGFQVSVETPWGSGEFQTTLLGRFNISNLLAVLTVLGILAIPLVDALAYLSELKAVSGRMQCLGGKGEPLVVVDYAHTPDALEQALKALREHCDGDLYCVFGCGGDRDQGKRPEMAAVAESYADHVILTSDNPRSEDPHTIIQAMVNGLKQPGQAITEADRARAIDQVIERAAAQDIVLVAGKGHETQQIVGQVTHSFDDREVVLQALQRRKRK